MNIDKIQPWERNLMVLLMKVTMVSIGVMGCHFVLFANAAMCSTLYVSALCTAAPSHPLSFSSCREFVSEFDRLYNVREESIYPHPNPMVFWGGVHLDVLFNTQFPLAYNFPINMDSGVVDRTFRQAAFYGFQHESNSRTSRKFSLISPEINMALSATSDCGSLRMRAFNEDLITQQFRITSNDQLESISCSGKVLSVGIAKSSWKCKSAGVEKGIVTITGTDRADAISACNSRNGCSNNSCSVTLTKNDYCVDGNKLTLKPSNPQDKSQQWRFYDDGIVNVACGRTNGNLAMTQISDDVFNNIALFEELQFSFVNPSSGRAISIGDEVSDQLSFVL